MRLAGLIRHHLASGDRQPQGSPVVAANGRQTPQTPNANDSNDAAEYSPVDYRCYPKNREEAANGANAAVAAAAAANAVDLLRYSRRSSLVFRPESAPTVLDMSPEGSLSGPPSVRDGAEAHVVAQTEVVEGEEGEHNGEDMGDVITKGFTATPDAMGRYSCDECGKIFKHPGSLQHHRHIHRGTHRCPSCGKAFSRRWDMERHLNKSKYGCPANRFSTGSAGSSAGSAGSPAAPAAPAAAPLPPAPPVGTTPVPAVAAAAAAAHMELLAASHNSSA